MDFLYLLKERFLPLSLMAIIPIISVILLIAIWKKKDQVSKMMLTFVTVISLILLISSLVLMLFTLVIGYNS
ncbi:hypothetical protein ASF99_13680 [Exiguobacterium sp. Leaf187]|uniref:hypothetical protein n=1 Tax=Exiguobacterium TaxID=33986 RepID=UPI0006AA1241|nr:MULTISPECIES: hypothetical protein [Exiguobacterium]KOP31475.1 hypothetical protein ADM98_01150 [Exiguobacterium sp. BMC-KP]KQS23549.1 hypothetical protein ASF99_13680 [Exiguobacterium sp. Leaf187]